MTDYQSEQDMEIEALEAILMDDLQEYNGTLPAGWTQHGKTYKVLLLPSEEGGEPPPDGYDVKAELLFAHTPEYPDEAPSVKLRSVQGLSDADIAAGQAVIEQEIESNKGMAMIFNLLTVMREWLVTKTTESSTASIDPLAAQRAAEEEAERKRLAARAHGTPVTVESFRAWKERFDAEMALQKAQLAESGKDEGRAERVAGKAWFMRESVSEMGTEEGAFSEDDEVDIDGSQLGSNFGREDGEQDEEEEDFGVDDDDDDEEDMLDSYLARQKT